MPGHFIRRLDTSLARQDSALEQAVSQLQAGRAMRLARIRLEEQLAAVKLEAISQLGMTAGLSYANADAVLGNLAARNPFGADHYRLIGTAVGMTQIKLLTTIGEYFAQEGPQ